MIPSRRAAAPARTLLRYQQPRRFASSTPHGEHHHAEPVNETFGRGFYVFIASVPVGLALYKYSTSDPNNKPWMTRLIENYFPKESTWERRNTLHTAAIERAAADRHLFHSQRASLNLELSFPEIFNTGSPMNVPAGNGSADLTSIVSHYQTKNRKIEEERVSRMKDGKVLSIYEDNRYF
ncbi:NADH-ubiquinone oxidoreductase [Histoplasma capsulatum]|uniref:NADH-ubiquinone oxidoreductase n=1 Tax=Ajellomyces capsulatus TaxID=5037 RepID=A0A8A1MGB1_AJECA|nr:predicted protein [Histoplasma mississippiense (nom. inval.)]EDN06105.1 predicted protein [Histoplasma mississippiense (nom. inval.)]QSS65638.1 NADH-ubiquinone oxidoreductase [Histoplasma capsulatum]